MTVVVLLGWRMEQRACSFARACSVMAVVPGRSPTEPVRRGGRPRRSFDLLQIKGLRQQGLSFRKIARRLHLGEGTVRRALQPDADRAAGRQNLKATAC